MKITFFSGILISIVFIIFSTTYIERISEARNVYNEELFSAETDNQALVIEHVGRYTNEIGFMSIVYFLLCAAASVFAFIQFRRKVFMFSGIVCSTGMIIWSIVMLQNPTGVSFDEVGPVWIVMTLIQTVVFIAGLKESFQRTPYVRQEFSIR
ncbi:MAG: hypothetical protein ACHQF2_00475 [Flavobacteriales bacterium]